MLEQAAHIAAILTGLTALVAYGHFRLQRASKRRALVSYLKSVKETANPGDKGQRSALHLIAKLGLTENEILQASFASARIKRRIAADPDTNRADALLFEYSD